MISRTLLLRTSRLATRVAAEKRTFLTSTSSSRVLAAHQPTARTPNPWSLQRRHNSNKSLADEKIEDITELFATAQDEFEIALEETEKVSVYAEEDRKAARDEFDKMKQAFQAVVEGENSALAEEVQRRIGQRVRELEQGIERMEEMAKEQD